MTVLELIQVLARMKPDAGVLIEVADQNDSRDRLFYGIATIKEMYGTPGQLKEEPMIIIDTK